MLVLLLISQTFASTQYHYTEQNVSRASAVFKKTAQASQKKLSNVERSLSTRSDMIQAIELASYLTEDSKVRAQVVPLKRELLEVQGKQQAFFDIIQSKYSDAFLNALNRAIASLRHKNVLECNRKSRFGHSGCPGEDISDSISKIIDKDSRLKSELKKINTMEWPDLKWSRIEYVGEVRNDKNNTHVDIALIAKKLLSKRMKRIDNEFESAYRQAKRVHSGDKESFLSAVKQEKARYVRRLAEEGHFIRSLLKDLAEGDKGCFFGLLNTRKPIEQLVDITLCNYPAGSAVCPGANKTDFALISLQNSKKHQKALTQRLQLPLSK